MLVSQLLVNALGKLKLQIISIRMTYRIVVVRLLMF